MKKEKDVIEERCPRCNSPSPELHPAVQHEGEVQICPATWHHIPRTAAEAHIMAGREWGTMELN